MHQPKFVVAAMNVKIMDIHAIARLVHFFCDEVFSEDPIIFFIFFYCTKGFLNAIILIFIACQKILVEIGTYEGERVIFLKNETNFRMT